MTDSGGLSPRVSVHGIQKKPNLILLQAFTYFGIKKPSKDHKYLIELNRFPHIPCIYGKVGFKGYDNSKQNVTS